MVTIVRLFVVLLHGVFVLGTLIDPHIPETNSATFVHCLASQNVIQIKNPFNPSWATNSKFVNLEWYIGNGTKEDYLLDYLSSKTEKSANLPKHTFFDFWGLQIINVDLKDSGKYLAKLLNQAETEIWSVNIEVASPPLLASDKLSMKQAANNHDNTVMFMCGEIASLGSPPVRVVFKAENGTSLPGVYKDGFLTLTVPAKEANSGKFTCEIDMSVSAAKCIDSKDRPRWHGAFTEPSKPLPAGSDAIVIIAAVMAAVVVITIIIVIIYMVRRRRKLKTYNAKDHEEKRSNQSKSVPLISSDENHYDKPIVSKGPIYKGPTTPSPYMVSRISQGNPDPKANIADNEEYEDMEFAGNIRYAPQPVSGKYVKAGDDRDKRRHEDGNTGKSNGREDIKDGQKPPRAKPRSIFLTPSMEALDKINVAVAGGEGSGATAIGTQV